MPTDVIAWRLFVTTLLVVILALVCWLETRVRVVQHQVEASYQMLLIWARTWGQPEEQVREAFEVMLGRRS